MPIDINIVWQYHVSNKCVNHLNIFSEWGIKLARVRHSNSNIAVFPATHINATQPTISP